VTWENAGRHSARTCWPEKRKVGGSTPPWPPPLTCVNARSAT